MIVSIERSLISGQVTAPPSKSYTHRAVIISALGPGGVVRSPLISADTKATISAVESIGADVRLDDDLDIVGVSGNPNTPDNVIDVDNSGTTLRFMAAVCALTHGAVLTGDSSIRKRPNGPLLSALNGLGAKAFSIKGDNRAPLVVSGKLRGGSIRLDGSVSSQFLSALLIACPLAEKETTITIEGELKSRPYAEITLDMLRDAGARIEVNESQFIIEGGQRYDLGSYVVPGDFSSASYLMAAAAVTCSDATIYGLYPSRQGDMAIVNILQDMGAKISWDKVKGILKISGAELKGTEVDASQTPDLVPTIAVLGSVAEGETVIKNAEHVRHKETDRLHAMALELSKMGAEIDERPDGLRIEGGSLKGAALHGHHDHRIVMALAVAGLVAGDTSIDTAESVEISYPNFFQDMRNLNADIRVRE
jgi:3-phosphoshikimate 1-carboxyvinyltransferase